MGLVIMLFTVLLQPVYCLTCTGCCQFLPVMSDSLGKSGLN